MNNVFSYCIPQLEVQPSAFPILVPCKGVVLNLWVPTLLGGQMTFSQGHLSDSPPIREFHYNL